MVDSNIAFRTQPIDTATPIRQAQADQNTNALAAEQVLHAQFQNMDAREQSRLRSTIVGAAQLKTYLDKGDLDGAHDFLVQRQRALHNRMAMGENVDTQETDYALDKLRNGDLEGLQNDVAGLMAAGQAYGMIGGQDGTPASVREWQYYNSLSPEQKKEWLNNKRAGSNIDLGGSVVRLGADGKPVTSYEKTVTPDNQPANAAATAQARAMGQTQGENAANADASLSRLGGLTKALQDLQTAGRASPGGIAENLGATVANKTNMGGAAADAQGDFIVKRAAAENAIREAFRVAGSGAQSDADALPFINMLPNAEDADSVKVAKTNAALEAVQNKVNALMQQRGLVGQPPAGGGAAPTQNLVKVSNGKETYMIDPQDLGAAQAEGFQQVQ